MIIDCQEEKIKSKVKEWEVKDIVPISEASQNAIKECKKQKLFVQSYECDKMEMDSFKKVCEYIASGYSPIEACRQYGMSIDGFFLFKHKNRDNKEVQDIFDEAFKSKGGVFIGRCEEVIDGLLNGKINSKTAEVALNGLFKLASIADKKYSDSPRIEVDARSVTVNQLTQDKMLELHNLLTSK